MKTALLKLLASIMSDAKSRKKAVVLVLSIAIGFLGLMCLPVVVLSSMGSLEIETPEIDRSMFTDSAFMATLDEDQQSQIAEFQSQGEAIATAMSAVGLPSETIKAQLIYYSYFADNPLSDFTEYANLFANASDDNALLESINSTYGIEIAYDDFMRSYTWTMNTTINEYMFADERTKNCADLAAWANNAYISGWGYMSGSVGERNESDRIRYCDNAGLMLGYLNYNPADKTFGNSYEVLIYTEQGDINSMPDVAGVGVFDGSQHGIYVGNGEVIYSSADCGYVTKDLVSNGSWTSWCTYDGVDYSQEVLDLIDGTENSEDESSSEN
jgi:hypothetical protein